MFWSGWGLFARLVLGDASLFSPEGGVGVKGEKEGYHAKPVR